MTTVPFRSRRSAMRALRELVSLEDPHAPLTALLEISDRCNEVCVHCFQIQGQKGELTTDDWRGVLDQLAELGVLMVTISGGEATLRPDFLDIIAYARKKRFSVKLFTNALRVDAAMADELARLAVQEVQISLYSPRAEVHDWVTGVPGSYDKVIEACRLLRARGVGVVLKSVLTSFNFDERDDYLALTRSLDADFMLDPWIDPREDGDLSPRAFGLTRDQILEAHRSTVLHAKPARTGPRPLDRSVCGACSGHVHVEPNGKVRPCTQLDVDVGDASSLREALSSPTARGIRELTWADIPGCRDCDLRRHCSRCFANSRKEVGDALAPYRSACDKALIRYELMNDTRPRVRAEAWSTGPFREVEPAVFEPFEVRRTAADEARLAELTWARKEAGAAPAPAIAAPGALVQIRRPGAKKSRGEVVPPLRAVLDGDRARGER